MPAPKNSVVLALLTVGMLALPYALAAGTSDAGTAPAGVVDPAALPKTILRDESGEYVINSFGERIPLDADPTIQKIVDSIDANAVFSVDYELTNLSKPDRRTGSSQYKAVMDWMKKEFQSYGLWSYFDSWSSYTNVVAVQNGTDTTSKTIWVTGGHCDTVANTVGADDDGSGCANTLYTAKILSQYKFKNTIHYIGFDAEEIGLVGSAHWVQQAKSGGLQVGGCWCTDMISVDSTAPYATQIRARSADQFMADILIKANTDYGINIDSLKVGSGPGSSDHASFQQNGFNAILLIEESLNGKLHTPQDTPSTINVKWYGQNSKVQAAAIATSAVPDSGGGGGSIASIKVTPDTYSMVVGQQKQFQAVAYDANGTPVNTQFTWAVSGGGTIDTAGTYNAQTAGTWTVFANASGKSGVATVTVTKAGQLALVVTKPTPVIMTADDTQQFECKGYDGAGNDVSITAQWHTSSGTITPAGLFTPGPIPAGAGYDTVTVWCDVSGSTPQIEKAVVTVFPGKPVSLAIDPATTEITADQTKAFVVTGKDKTGNDIPDPAVSWSADNGQVAKTGNNTGTFTPEKVGTWTVKATSQVGTLFAEAKVTVTPGVLANAFISPASQKLAVGETVDFKITGEDKKKNPIPDVTASGWTATNGIGDVADGKFTAKKAGVGKVQAVVADAKGTKKSVSADVTVTAGSAIGPVSDLGGLLLPVILIIAVVVAAAAGLAVMGARKKRKAREQQGYWQQQQGYGQPGWDQGQNQWPPQQ